MKSILLALSVPKIITVLCLLGLGVNGLVQVGLQRDMTQKAEQLRGQIAQTQQLSLQMKDGLSGLADLRDTSTHMAKTLTALQTSTSAMSQGLGTLEGTVSGIHGTVQALGTSVSKTDKQVQATAGTASQLLDILNGIQGVNDDVISHLNGMIADQQRINANLQEMNRKTQLLPQWGGGN